MLIGLRSSIFAKILFSSLLFSFLLQISSYQSSNRIKRDPEDATPKPAPRTHHAKPNIITVCTKDGGKYTLETSTCKNGAWLPQPFDVNCICVDGLWAISENYCDKNFLLLAGENQECFEVSKPIRRLVSLYNPNDPADKGKKLIIRSNLEKFDSFTRSYHTRSSDNGSYIIRFDDTRHELYLRHTEGYQENFWQRCVQASRKPKKFQIIQANGVTFADSKKGCRNSQDLEYPMKKMTGATWGLDFGQSWHPIDGVGRKSLKCTSTCLENKERKQRQIESSDYQEDSLESGLTEKGKGITKRQDNNTIAGGNETITESPIATTPTAPEITTRPPSGNSTNGESSDELLDPSEERYQKIDRDTSKIAYYLKNWNMKKEPGPKLPYKEYKYLQYARIILLKTCPATHVPVGALTDFLRLFRYLVYESLRKSPEHYSEDINKAANKRIVASLESCYESAQSMEFSSGNGCSYDVESVIYGGKTIPATLPPHLLSNQNNTDLILETMWKMILHTHYLCTENFIRNGGDLSTMYMKLQEFLTDPHLMFRWENPGSSSNQVYRILFPSLDFTNFVNGINACVAGAHGVSKYSKWLKRPTSNLQKTSRIMAKKMTKVSARGRSLYSLPTLFNKKGYCTNGYDDPIRWSKYNKDINAVCDSRL